MWGIGIFNKYENEEKSLKTGKSYHVTGALGSNLINLATPGQDYMGVELLIGPPGMPQKFDPWEKIILAMLKRMVSMATPNSIFLNGGVPTKTTISPLLLSIDYLPWYQIKVKT